MAKRDALSGMSDTIAAVSTAPGRSGRAITRLSGRRAFEIARQIAADNFEIPSGYFSNECGIRINGAVVPCVFYLMPAPRSYTREDIAELHTFGAPSLVGAVLDRLLELGARSAEPGEFTRRAFINGRIDLAQAEAVLSVIRSRSAAEEQAAQRALAGELSGKISNVRERLEGLCVKTEASIDLAEQGIETITPSGLASELKETLQYLPSPDTARENIPEEGVVTVIAGKTNAGKSTLFNRLCGRNQALVSPVSGTTRDWLSAEIEIDGITFVLIDTAGTCVSTGEIEQLAQEAGRKQTASAQITILVIDAANPPGTGSFTAPYKTISKAECACPHPNNSTLTVLNKTDLTGTGSFTAPSQIISKAECACPQTTAPDFIRISALTNTGIDTLRKKLVDMITSGLVPAGASQAALSARQRHELSAARDAVRRAAEVCPLGLDLAASDIRDALTALGSILGWGAGEEILDAIFKDFCVGK